ncbi:MAG: nitronate monooxygenase [Gammaproteobacteria bacterium]|nr:nitronate monooxygenase [Gammaproteobacteria bacterium]
MFHAASRDFCKKANIKLPIIQAPMAGSIVTPALVAEVSKYGGLGTLPLGYLSIDDARAMIQATAEHTKQFVVNVFVPSIATQTDQQHIDKMLTYINTYRIKLGLTALSEIAPSTEPDIEKLLEMIVDEGVSMLSITFGILNQAAMEQLRLQGVFVMGTATTVAEGLALESSGCHAVIAQGYEAGGHRGGGFLKNDQGGLIGTMALIPQMVDALNIPVIAAGGIMEGRGIAAALTLGATAVQMGTAFLLCDESKASPMHKQAILNAPSETICTTAAFTGKVVRGVHNEFVTATERLFAADDLLPYPLQHQVTRELRQKANQDKCAAYAGLWSGQATQLGRALSVQTLMKTLEDETMAAWQHN